MTLFNKVMSFWLRFVTKRDFDCEQVKQQTSQPELKHVSVVRLSEITPLLVSEAHGSRDPLVTSIDPSPALTVVDRSG